MTKFLPLPGHELGRWRCNDGYQTESHAVYFYLPDGKFMFIHVAYVKIGFVTVAKASVFYSMDGVNKLTVNPCSNFQVNKDNMGMTCDEMAMEWKDNNLVINLKGKALGGQGTLELSMNKQHSYQLDPTIHGDSTIHYMLSEPLSVSGHIKINNQDIDLKDTIGYYLHTIFPNRFDGVYSHSYLSFFDSQNHKVLSIIHQPRSPATAPATAPLIQQVYIHGSTTTATTSAQLNLHDQYEDSHLHHTLPKSFTLDLPDVNWSVNVKDLHPLARIDALEQIPYLARKIITKILPSPCFYVYYTKATLTTPESTIEGQLFFERAQF